MKWLTDPILDTVSSVQGGAERLLAGGGELFRATFTRVPLLSSVLVDETATERHETHVFLVPMREADEDYMIYTSQRLPPGYAKANDLPRVRIFHLPGIGAEQTLCNLLRDELRAELDETEELDVANESLGDLLGRIGGLIDRESGKVTGGLLLVGGAIALVNPLLGARLAAKALIPSLGGKLSTEGLKILGKQMNRFSRHREDKQRDREAERELAAVKNHSLVNPFLVALEHNKPDMDLMMLPLTERFKETAGCDAEGLQSVTARALIALQAEVGLPESFGDWLAVIAKYTDDQDHPKK